LSDGVTATFDVGANSVTFASAFGDSSSASVEKTGAGTLTVAGAISYTGTTTVDNGTLVVATTTATQPTVALSTVGGAGTFSVGDGTHPTNVTVDAIGVGVLHVAAGSTLTINALPGLSDGSLAPVSKGGGISPVPEPSTLGFLLFAGLAALGTYFRRR
jgi:fibronectin-binding autotransporter adhesin